MVRAKPILAMLFWTQLFRKQLVKSRSLMLKCAVAQRDTPVIAVRYVFYALPPSPRGEIIPAIFQSFQSCEHLYYRDTYNRSAGLLGTCNRCPCENADSCSVQPNRRIKCECIPGYYGETCSETGRSKSYFCHFNEMIAAAK